MIQPSRAVTVVDATLLLFFVGYLGSWLAGVALFYAPDAPVLSPFTAMSLAILSGTRLARRFLDNWPTPLSMAWIVIVVGGNLSSVIMQFLVPRLLVDSFPAIVPSSPLTSLGIIFFCSYELLVLIRETPQQVFILDDILLHLAIVPGVLSVVGYFLATPAYVSMAADPRVGIGVVEIFCLAAYASAAALSNPNLFLWRFLAASRVNILIFITLFANQFIAPVIVAYFDVDPVRGRSPGLEVFVLLAGVVATLAFLSFEAYQASKKTNNPM